MIFTKRTRHERKEERNSLFALRDSIRRRAQDRAAEERRKFEREHPVLSGKVPVTDYIPPPGQYHPNGAEELQELENE